MTEGTLRKAKQGHSFTATKDGKKCSLFVFDGQPVCLKSVFVSLEHFSVKDEIERLLREAYDDVAREPIPDELRELVEKLK